MDQKTNKQKERKKKVDALDLKLKQKRNRQWLNFVVSFWPMGQGLHVPKNQKNRPDIRPFLCATNLKRDTCNALWDYIE